MSNNAYIGVDPGASGAMCIIVVPEKGEEEIHFLDHKSNEIIERYKWLFDAGEELNIKKAMLEKVHSLMGMSAKSNFTFGGQFFMCVTLLTLQRFGWDYVQPKTWQKTVGIPEKKKGIKRSSAQLKKLVAERCLQIYPNAKIYGPKGGLLDGRSDALMIAHYCRLIYN